VHQQRFAVLPARQGALKTQVRQLPPRRERQELLVEIEKLRIVKALKLVVRARWRSQRLSSRDRPCVNGGEVPGATPRLRRLSRFVGARRRCFPRPGSLDIRFAAHAAQP
jgi:hypothetical protein